MYFHAKPFDALYSSCSMPSYGSKLAMVAQLFLLIEIRFLRFLYHLIHAFFELGPMKQIEG